jgi:hypothetical protein
MSSSDPLAILGLLVVIGLVNLLLNWSTNRHVTGRDQEIQEGDIILYMNPNAPDYCNNLITTVLSVDRKAGTVFFRSKGYTLDGSTTTGTSMKNVQRLRLHPSYSIKIPGPASFDGTGVNKAKWHRVDLDDFPYTKTWKPSAEEKKSA